jgi:hypothetical protein
MSLSTVKILIPKKIKTIGQTQSTYWSETEVVAKKMTIWWLKPTTRPIYIFEEWECYKGYEEGEDGSR